MFVQTFIPELAVKALDIGVLRRLAFAYRQAGFTIKPVGALVVDLVAFAAQQGMDPSINESTSFLGQFDDPGLKLFISQ